MQYMAVAESDIGMKNINQDCVLIKHTKNEGREILMAVICDGLGGFAKSEIASTLVTRECEEWFSIELPYELKHMDLTVIGNKWELLLRTLNLQLQEYGQKIGEKFGTTFTGVLFIDDRFISVHVGDTRLYYIGESVKQLTCDHTYVAREIAKGNITADEARTDKYRNVLLQCVGASKKIEPQIISGRVKQGVYMLCSDGFRHKITEQEIFNYMNLKILKNEQKMSEQCRRLICLNKEREEKDNISVILIRAVSGNRYRMAKVSEIFEKIFRN